ncbi:MAG TPA: hypothetical protein VGM98_08735 [Schlesneria sp.]
MSFVATLIARTAHQWVVPVLLRAVKRFPLVAGFAAALGQALGIWLIWECGSNANWPMVALGVLMLMGYTAMMMFVAAKWLDGTWGRFCDYVSSVVE